MAHIAHLPVEILEQIVQDLLPDYQGSLSALSLSCKYLYVQLTPHVYRLLRLRMFGPDSWAPRTANLKLLACAPGFAAPKSPAAAEDADDDVEMRELAVDRKGKGVPGRPRPAPGAGEKTWVQLREAPLNHVRGLVLDGYWLKPKEEVTDEYWTSDDGVLREHKPFIHSLDGVLSSLQRLDVFVWKITRILPPSTLVVLSRFETLSDVTLNGDSHVYARTPTYPYHNPSTVTNDPSIFGNNKLVTLRALQTGDIHQVIQYGDVIRTPQTWANLRNLEVDISPGLMTTLVELEPLEPDLLGALFRPPPPARGVRDAPKLKLHQLKLRDISFQPKGIAAVAQSVEPGELRDLDFFYCQEGTDLLRRWEDDALYNLERLHIKEELALHYICKFLRQFGPDGICRKLRTLELCCWHVDRWSMFDPVHAELDSDDEMLDGDHPYSEEEDELDCHCPFHTHYGSSRTTRPKTTNTQFIPQPWRSIQELRGSRGEGWGLERLMLDMRPGMASPAASLLPHQDLFFGGFWRLRELAIPVTYDVPERWNGLVKTVAALPELESLFLLNARGERTGPRPYVTFPAGLNTVLPPYNSANTIAVTRRTTARPRNTKKKKDPEPEEDKVYVDALTIAARNRLHRHFGSAPPPIGTSSTAAVAGANSWMGKLRYIGIRNTFPVVRAPARVWRVRFSQNEPRVQGVMAAVEERKRSLRSSKRRRVESDDWRVARSGERSVTLEELDEKVKFKVAGGLFKGMERNEV